MNLTKEELNLTIEAINHAIAYRLNERTRMSDIHSLRVAKEKLLKAKKEISK